VATAWACLAPGLSYPEPTSVTAPAFVVGDEWTFDRTKEMGTTRFVRSRIDLRVDRVDGDAMLVGVKPDGAPADYEDHRLSLDWSQSRVIGGQPTVTARPFRFPMAPGDSWTVEFRQAEVHDGQTNTHWRATYTVVGWTDVTTPAGTFHALEIKQSGVAEGEKLIPQMATAAAVATPNGAATVGTTQRAARRAMHNTLYGEWYYAPAIKYFVKYVQEQYEDNVRVERDEDIISSFKSGSAGTASVR
jgi:hypothetical protein